MGSLKLKNVKSVEYKNIVLIKYCSIMVNSSEDIGIVIFIAETIYNANQATNIYHHHKSHELIIAII